MHLITPTEGPLSLEILDIANGWGFGQEFVMTYKEHDSRSTETFESHGMLHRWDYSIAIPVPLAFYPEEGERPKRYCEEPLDCSTEYVTPRIDVQGPYPYISITDQEAVMELTGHFNI